MGGICGIKTPFARYLGRYILSRIVGKTSVLEYGEEVVTSGSTGRTVYNKEERQLLESSQSGMNVREYGIVSNVGGGDNLSSSATFGRLLLTINAPPSTPPTSILTHFSAQARHSPRLQPRGEPRLQPRPFPRFPASCSSWPGFEVPEHSLCADRWGREMNYSDPAFG